ncbi:putative c2h2 transcription factor protein [Phaeoacremonium minimum UCRPA7]|uniref:Putative c2h2 transcription factor protein n=1 Tax=Phaeoacremonium minimum (strain UCR-PA7) TaxID=1286976 RepID=R8BI01_PHAM7|nr:putative c2h2 transcription factor protein [Phaeoacremonium minimum UCRPA7]EON98936.1 putative c2h2 transcription factor protein [Phaeoacremonium minimum UCRPA7]
MDDFVNWDNADPATGMVGLDLMPPQTTMTNDDPNHNLDLALANVDGDDFSFWALEHFEANNVALDNMLALPDPLNVNELQVETPGAPCAHCQTGGFSCKRIQEANFTAPHLQTSKEPQS